ncbi:MAG: DUF3560 domain-containing protein [Spirulinaceae cyanobacterium SM2_1_0]|nr:DUF3560 domain-containing protein [Spirulinaceae cyanobacterium SM2_1_0]
MNEYEMKQADRRKRYQALADKAKNEAKGLIDSAYRQIDWIPPGQPILVGHHSERRHRAALERHDKTMRRALDAEQRAKHYAQKANSMDTGISADDPEAVEKLEAKLQKLEKEQALHKLINKAIRLNRKNPDKARNLLRQGIEQLEPHGEVERKVNFYLSQEEGIPDFTLRNNNANIRRIKQRIEELKARTTQEFQSTTINGVEIVEDVEANRLRLIFPHKPEESIRKKLKSHGFRWSPTANAWQRQLTNQARYWGKHIAENLNRDSSQ